MIKKQAHKQKLGIQTKETKLKTNKLIYKANCSTLIIIVETHSLLEGAEVTDDIKTVVDFWVETRIGLAVVPGGLAVVRVKAGRSSINMAVQE